MPYFDTVSTVKYPLTSNLNAENNEIIWTVLRGS
jgi:hypothetical protein